MAHNLIQIGWAANCHWTKKVYILTGQAQGNEQFAYETSQPGIFAVGDLRSGSVKRVASAVGEGSVVVSAIHQYLERKTDRVAGTDALLTQQSKKW